jgi:hypothetical protein
MNRLLVEKIVTADRKESKASPQNESASPISSDLDERRVLLRHELQNSIVFINGKHRIF